MSTSIRWWMMCGMALAWAARLVYAADSFPAPKQLGDPATLGRGIQRTMLLLSDSTPERRHTVRILFYGQSITEQKWAQAVTDDLRRRFPHANLAIENRALGGFSSQRLVKTAETDLYSFYPDLVVFHVYGSHVEYENIIRRIRERTTAEILIQTDHVTADGDFTEETNPTKLKPEGKIWNSFMNYQFLPGVAQKYGCGMVDQRNLWKAYLKDHQLSAHQLLRDSVHLNDHGCYVMAEFAKSYLVQRTEPQPDPYNCERVKTLGVGSDVTWENGRLAVSFEGNRVDVVMKEGVASPAKVLIDGRAPSTFPELYQFTRAVAKPGSKWPVVADLGWDKNRQVENWTMAVKKVSDKVYAFELRGSKTGPDGSGRSDAQFTSNSGAVVIDPEDWDVEYALGLAGVKPVPAEFIVQWQSIPFFVDEFVSPGVKDKATETMVTLAQGLPNGKHRLEIIGSPETPIKAIRIYRPLGK